LDLSLCSQQDIPYFCSRDPVFLKVFHDRFMDKLFHLFEITGELVEKILAEPAVAHWHDFEEVILITEGSLDHFIDFTLETVNSPAVCYIPTGKTHRLVPKPGLRGWVINYRPEFIPGTTMTLYSHFFTSATIPIGSASCTDRYSALCTIINNENNRDLPDHNTIRHLVQAFLSMVDADRKRNLPDETVAKSAQMNAFKSFLLLVEEFFRNNEGVSFYAEKLNMTERNLNLICRNNIQKSVSEIIETRKLFEAKHLLLNSDKTVAEIGYELGYNEKSYFSRVFHARMGITPSRFREQTRALIS